MKCKCGKELEDKKYCNTFCREVDYNSYSGETFKEALKRFKKKNRLILKLSTE